MKGKLKFKKIIFIVLGIAILLGVSIYFLLFYNKTIVYKCSSVYNPAKYSSKRLKRNVWDCKKDGVYLCNHCTAYDSVDNYMFFTQVRNIFKKRVVESYNFVIFDTRTKEKITTIEKAYPDDELLIYNDGKLTAIRLIKFESDGSIHFIIYNLEQNNVLGSAQGFHSRRYAAIYSELLNHIDHEIEEQHITNNIIIAYDSDDKFGLVNIKTGEVIVPMENKTLYRTQYGNFIGTIDTDNGPVISLYDSNGKLKFQQNKYIDNYHLSYVVEDAGYDYVLVENAPNYNLYNFVLMDFNGNRVSNSKIYWSDIINGLLSKMEETEYRDKYRDLDNNGLMSAYMTGNFKITVTDHVKELSDDRIIYITFSLYDSESTLANKPYITSVMYEFNFTTNALKNIG